MFCKAHTEMRLWHAKYILYVYFAVTAQMITLRGFLARMTDVARLGAPVVPPEEGVEGQAGAVTYTGWSAIHFAAGFGKVDAVDALLDAGADLESQNTRGGHHAGWTPWHRAVRWWLSPGKPNCIQHLLELGVVADARTDQDMTVAKLANPEIHDALELQLRRLPRPSASAERLLDELMQVKADWAEAGHGHQG